MKRIAVLVLTLVMALSVCACASKTETASSNATADNTASQTENSKSLKDIYEQVKKEAYLPSEMSDFTASRLTKKFGITDEQYTDFAGAICTQGQDQTQIIYIKAADDAAAKDIAEKLQKDWQATYNVIKNYSPDQVAIIEKAKVETDGLYVSLVIASDADKIKSIFKENIVG